MFQKWSPLKCTKASASVLGLILLFGTAEAAPKVVLPALLKEVEAKYGKSKTLKAEFSQINENVNVTQKKKTSTGKIFVKRPSKIRWETLKPDVNLLISDGSKYWFYTPPFDEGERGQLIEKKSSQIQSKLADALLAGSFSASQFQKIEKKGPHQFVITPKPGTSGTVARATIEIDPQQKLIQKVILEHKGGNRSEITLSKIELGPPIEDQLFVFSAPPNTDVVKANE